MTTLRSFVLFGALLLTSTAGVAAQNNLMQVIPGRDFEEQKMLTPGLTDVWKLHVEKDEMLWCQVDSSAFDPVLDLVDAQGTLLGSNDGPGTHSELWLRIAGEGDVEFEALSSRHVGAEIARVAREVNAMFVVASTQDAPGPAVSRTAAWPATSSGTRPARWCYKADRSAPAWTRHRGSRAGS